MCVCVCVCVCVCASVIVCVYDFSELDIPSAICMLGKEVSQAVVDAVLFSVVLYVA